MTLRGRCGLDFELIAAATYTNHRFLVAIARWYCRPEARSDPTPIQVLIPWQL